MNNALSLLEAQQAIHELIARQRPLDEILEAITAWMRQMMPGALISIMRYDPDSNTISLVPNTQFSDRYTARMQNRVVGPDVGLALGHRPVAAAGLPAGWPACIRPPPKTLFQYNQIRS